MAHSGIQKLLAFIEELIPVYMAIPEDYAKSKGVASVCIINEDGQIYGKVFGNDKLRGRDSFKLPGQKPARFGLPVIKPTNTKKWYLQTKSILICLESVYPI